MRGEQRGRDGDGCDRVREGVGEAEEAHIA